MIKKSLSTLRNRLIAGLFIVIPIGFSLWLVFFLYGKMTGWSLSFLQQQDRTFWVEQGIRMLTLLVMLALLIAIGQIAKYTIGKRIISLTEYLMLKLPMINTVYSTVRQLWHAIWSPDNGMFSKVVLFEYPKKDIYVIGFLTNENKGAWELHDKVEKELLSIFLPTTPNPTSGVLLFIPRENCTFLDMDVTEGMRLVISGGVVSNANKSNNINEPQAIDVK